MTADYPKPSSNRSPEMRTAAALERIAEMLCTPTVTYTTVDDVVARLTRERDEARKNAEREANNHCTTLELLEEATSQRDEARRERDCWERTSKHWEASSIDWEGLAKAKMSRPLSWSPEPPKVEGLYLYKHKGHHDSGADTGWYSTGMIAGLANTIGFLWCGPLVIREAEEGGGK